jgi:RNA polymerase sigma factor (sigma-70 family)
MNRQPSLQSPPPTTTRAAILEELLAAHGSTIRSQAFRHSPDPDAAEDALQDACVQFLRAYQGPPGLPALRWMQTTTKRCAWAIARRQRREPPSELADLDAAGPELDPAHLAEREEQRRDRVAAVEALKPDQRSALILLGFGCSYREIGERRGWTYTKVNRCVTEGRAVLRRAEQAPDRSPR